MPGSRSEKQNYTINSDLPIAWFAGYLECTGSIMLASSNNSKVPTLSFKGPAKNVERLRSLLLNTEFQRKQRRDSQSERTVFRVTGNNAKALLERVESAYNPLRRGEIEGLLEEDAAKIIQARSERNRPVQETANPYVQLLDDPDYLAGIIDGGVSIGLYDSAQERHLVPYITMFSSNIQLLQALQKKFGGSVSNPEEGTTTARFALSHQKARSLHEYVAPYLQLQQARAKHVFLEDHKKPKEEEQIQEAFANEHAFYLAGFLTLRGSMYGKKTHNKNQGAIIPRIRLHGNLQDMEAWTDFMHIFHPHIKSDPSHKLHFLVINGEATRKIMGAILPLIHKRVDELRYFVHDWDNLSRRERFDAYEQLQKLQKNPEQNTQSLAYEKLVQNPQYVAGLLDAGKAFRLVTASSPRRSANSKLIRFPFVGITTTNYNVLSALQTQFGGEINQNSNRNSFTWSVKSQEERAKLYGTVKEHLVVQKKRAEEIMRWFDDEYMLHHIGTFLAKTMTFQTKEEITEQVLKIIGGSELFLSSSIEQGSINFYLEQLIASDRLEKTNEANQERLKLSITHPDNFQFVEHSPMAMKELLEVACRSTLMITATGNLLAISTPSGPIFYENGIQSREYTNRIQKTTEPFIQFARNGRTINIIRKGYYIHNIRILAAIEETLRLSLERSLEFYMEDLEVTGDDTGIVSLSTFSPAEEAKRLLRLVRSSS